MRRVILTWVIVAVSALVACSGTPDAADSSDGAGRASSEVESEQTLAEACGVLAEQLRLLTRSIEVLQVPDPNYPHGMVNHWGEQADEFGLLAESLIHPEVEGATALVYEDLVVFHDVMHQIYIEGIEEPDPSFRDALDQLEGSHAALRILCFG